MGPIIIIRASLGQFRAKSTSQTRPPSPGLILYTLYCITYTPKYSGFLKFVYKINTTLNPLPHIQILIPFSIFLRYPWNVPWQTFFDFCSKWSPNSIYQNIYNLDEVEDYSRRQFNRLKINFLHRSRRGAFIEASYYTTLVISGITKLVNAPTISLENNTNICNHTVANICDHTGSIQIKTCCIRNDFKSITNWSKVLYDMDCQHITK